MVSFSLSPLPFPSPLCLINRSIGAEAAWDEGEEEGVLPRQDVHCMYQTASGTFLRTMLFLAT